MVFAVKTSSVATTAFLVGLVFPFPLRELLLRTLYSYFYVKLNFLALTFEALCGFGTQLLAFVFFWCFPSWGLVHWYSVSLEGFPYFMPEDNNKWSPSLIFLLLAFWERKFRERKLQKIKIVLSTLKIEWHSLSLWSLLMFLSL